MSSEFSCFEVTLSSATPCHAQRHAGRPDHADRRRRNGGRRARGRRSSSWPSGRSTPVIVTASSRVGARKGLTVSGKGRGVRARRGPRPAPWRPGVDVRVVVRVAAERARPVAAAPLSDARLPLRRRPQHDQLARHGCGASRPSGPARAATSPPTAVWEFRVTRDFVVRGLQVDDVRLRGHLLATDRSTGPGDAPSSQRCSGTRRAEHGPHPRDRASYGAQLLTTSPRRPGGDVHRGHGAVHRIGADAAVAPGPDRGSGSRRSRSGPVRSAQVSEPSSAASPAGRPVAVRELATRLSLHANTIRPHLRRLVDAGLVASETRRGPSAVGPAPDRVHGRRHERPGRA